MNTLKEIQKALRAIASKEKAAFFPRFFKTGKGEYGEGDIFLGVTVPQQRAIAKQFYKNSDAQVITALLDSAIHEERLIALYLLIASFKDAQKKGTEKKWVDLYLKKIDRVNNWDLVDASAHYILGAWLENKDRSILYKLAATDHLWKNRIAVVSTFHFIRNNDLKDLLQLSEQLLQHPHDLMHKAIGWMLREGWKRDPVTIEKFIITHRPNMPRTMLRYAIEKMEEEKRLKFLRG